MTRSVLWSLSTACLIAGYSAVAAQLSDEPPRLRRTVGDIRRAEAGRQESSPATPQRSHLEPIEGGRIPLAGPVTDGVAWLDGSQNASGSWGSIYEFLDTCTVVESLSIIDPGSDALNDGAVWLAAETAANYEYLARQIAALAGVPGYEGFVSALTDELLEARNPAEPDPGLPNWPEGGWGIAEGYETDCLTTALAMKALDAVGLNGGFAVNDEPLGAGETNTHEWDIPDDAIKARITITVSGSTIRLRMKEGSPPGGGDPYFEIPPGSWLIVFPDSGLPFTPGHNYITVQSTGSAATYTMTASYETPTFDTRTLAEPLAYLREAQNVDGGWGLQRGQPTELYTTLHVLLTLAEWLHYDFETEHADGITYLKSQQLGDGSFGYDGTPIAYVTALAALNLIRSETYPFSMETEDAISALLSMQEVDGSWNQEPYDTALAVLALWDHNQDPTADAGSDQNVTDADEDCLEDITLDGTGSADVDGTIESYVWTEDDVEIATGPSPVVTLPVGTHTLELTVTDNGGKTASDTVIIDVVGTGIPPDVCHCCFPGGICMELDPTVCTDSAGTVAPGACAVEACCLPDDTCAMLDPECCEQEGGAPLPGEVCSEEFTGCCLPGGECIVTDTLCCVLQGGNPQLPDDLCTSPEACCLPDNACQDLDPLCCVDQGGEPQGIGTTCTAPEACCLPDGTCQNLAPLCCENLDSVPQGAGTTCTTAEACCLTDGTCIEVDPLCCDEQGGVPQGAGTACTIEEACCLWDGTCIEVDPLCCDDMGGVAQGPGTACTTPEACCLKDCSCIEVDPLCCDEMGGWLPGAPNCLGDNNGNGMDDVCEPEGLKWVQCPDLDPTGLDVQAQQPPGVLLADDFLCTQAGRITEIRIWGSWLGDVLPDGDAGNVTFTLSIHADVPEGPGGWSEPGDSLWTHTFNPGEFGYEVYDSGLDEGWYDPLSGTYEPSADAVCWLYTFPVPGGEEFSQEGTPEDPIVYWLDAQALSLAAESYFGWKTSLFHWNDDAVWAEGDESAHGAWQELRYPTGHPMQGDSIDLAFVLIGGPAVKRPLAEDCATIAPGTRCSLSGTCAVDADCTNESHCVLPPAGEPGDGVCYAPKLRYLSIARNPEQIPDTRRRVKLDEGTLLGWVGTPVEDDPGFWIAPLVDTPTTVAEWPDVVHVYGCEIAHANLSDITEQHCGPNAPPGGEVAVHHCYVIQAISATGDIGNEDHYSEALTLCTPTTWGDTVGATPPGSPADGNIGLADIMATIFYFQGNPTTPLTWVDIAPSTDSDAPDQNVGLGDIMGAIAGFQGQMYPGLGPKNCQ